MKITGAAPKIAVPTFLFLLLTAVVDHLKNPYFKITPENRSASMAIGAILLLIGAGIIVHVARKLKKSFNSSTLMTDGLYAVVRNPMYTVYLLFIIPGIALLLDSWLVLTTVVVNFILLKLFIKSEYRYLEEKFSEEYKRYLSTVWIRFL